MPQNYTTLLADLTNFADNNDISSDLLSGHIIPMAELGVSRALKTSGFDQFTTGTLTAGGTNVPIPSNMIRPRALIVVVDNVAQEPMEQKEFPWLLQYAPAPSTSGVPLYYAHENASQWRIGPFPSSAFPYRLWYSGKLTNLNAGTGSTNWLTENAYDLLHAGCMRILARYLQDDSAAPNARQGLIAIWDQRYAELLNAINGTELEADADEFRVPTLPPTGT